MSILELILGCTMSSSILQLQLYRFQQLLPHIANPRSFIKRRQMMFCAQDEDMLISRVGEGIPPFIFSLHFFGLKWGILIYSYVIQKEMRRQLTKQSLGRVYREFSRQKYNKYKHQFPKMRESEVVSKIIKEWEMMATPQKQTLSQKYYELKYIKDQDEKSSPSSARKTPNKVEGINYTPSPLSKNLTPGNIYTASHSLKFSEDDSEFHRNSDRMEERSQKSSSLSLLVDKPKKEPILSISKNTQYIVFYKFHYGKLSKEHPKWTASKISQIIKLLWLKRQKAVKRNSSVKNRKTVKSKLIRKASGRVHFRKIKMRQGYSTEESILMWKQLPYESKKLFEQRGRGEVDITTKKSPPSNSMPLRCQKYPETSLLNQFMHKKMES